MKDSYSIRPASKRDFDELIRVEHTCFDSERLKPRQLRYLLTKAKAQTWAATVDNQIVGYAMCLTPKLPRPARLYSIAIMPNFRDRKIARNLMSTMRQFLNEKMYKFWRLEVDEHNTKAFKLYEREGFVTLEKIEGYYENGHDAIRMQQKLNDL